MLELQETRVSRTYILYGTLRTGVTGPREPLCIEGALSDSLDFFHCAFFDGTRRLKAGREGVDVRTWELLVSFDGEIVHVL